MLQMQWHFNTPAREMQRYKFHLQKDRAWVACRPSMEGMPFCPKGWESETSKTRLPEIRIHPCINSTGKESEHCMHQPKMNARGKEESGIWVVHQLLTVLDFPPRRIREKN